MNPSQIVALASPFVIGFATLLAHFLAPATVAEIGTILGLAVTMLTAVRNLFVVAPSTTRAAAAAAKIASSALVALFLFGVLVLGCLNTAQQTASVSLAEAACLADEAASSVIPAGAFETAAQDIALVCTTVPVPAIVQFLVNLFAAKADAGVLPASGPYVPSPHVQAAKKARGLP